MWKGTEEQRQTYGEALRDMEDAKRDRDAVYLAWKGDRSAEADREREMARHRLALARIATRVAAERMAGR
jgi:hypothetical protein